MKTENKQQLIQVHGNGYLIYFNEKYIDGEYEYNTCEISNSPTRQDIIESMIASKYTTGAEFAVINNKEDDQKSYDDYQKWRELCKITSNEIISKI